MIDPQSLDFGGKTVLVTGAASGIGAAMAEQFRDHGATLKLADRNADGLRRQADLLDARVETFVYEQSETASVIELAGWAGQVDVLLNNAGIAAYGGLQSQNADTLERVIKTDLLGPIVLANEVARGMIERGGGVIVNTTSQLAFCGAPGRAVYASAKAGLAQFTRSAAAEWAASGVRVVAIAPGRTLTPLNAPVLGTPEQKAAGLSEIPAGRFGDAQEMAKLALILASEVASYVVGHSLIADGGYVVSH